MVDPTHVIRGASAATGASASQGVTKLTGADFQFQSLLERLENDARRLAEQSNDVKDPRSLERAVDSAQASLQDALTLSDRLLEAYRAALVRDDAAPSASSGKAESASPAIAPKGGRR